MITSEIVTKNGFNWTMKSLLVNYDYPSWLKKLLYLVRVVHSLCEEKYSLFNMDLSDDDAEKRERFVADSK